MLYYIDKTLVEKLTNGESSKGETSKQKHKRIQEQKRIMDALFYIALGQYKGCHFVYSERPNIIKLKDFYCKNKKGSIEHNVFQQLDTDFFDLSSIYNYFKGGFYTKILIDDETDSQKEPNMSIININKCNNGFRFFESETTLLCENLMDVTFYNIILDYHLLKVKNEIKKQISSRDKKNTPKYLDNIYRFSKFAGGGSTIGECYRYFAENQHSFCLAITDRDCLLEGKTLGDTAKSIKNIDNDIFFNCYHYIIGPRDSENLIPLGIIMLLSEDKKTTVNKLQKLINNNKDILRKVLKYFDYKSGISKHKTNKDFDLTMNIVQDLKLMNEEKINNVRLKFYEKKGQKPDYEKWKALLGITGSESQGKIIDGFGDRLLERFCNSQNQKWDWDDITNELSSNKNLDTEWHTLGSMILNFCCSIKLQFIG